MGLFHYWNGGSLLGKQPNKTPVTTMAQTPRRQKRSRIPSTVEIEVTSVASSQSSPQSPTRRRWVPVRRSRRLEAIRKTTTTMNLSTETGSKSSKSKSRSSSYPSVDVAPAMICVRPGTLLCPPLVSPQVPPPPPAEAPPPPTELIRWVILGPAQAGKTSLVSSFCQREYIDTNTTGIHHHHQEDDPTVSNVNTVVSSSTFGMEHVVPPPTPSSSTDTPPAPKEWVPMELAYAKKDYAFVAQGTVRSVRLQLYDVQADVSQSPPMWLQNLWQRSSAILLVVPLHLRQWKTVVLTWLQWLQKYYTGSGAMEQQEAGSPLSTLPPIHLLLSQVDHYQGRWTDAELQRVRQHVHYHSRVMGVASVHWTTATPVDTHLCVTMDTVVQTLLHPPPQHATTAAEEETGPVDNVSALLELPAVQEYSTPRKAPSTAAALVSPETPGMNVETQREG
jgi:GTPase SAR1 family protein